MKQTFYLEAFVTGQYVKHEATLVMLARRSNQAYVRLWAVANAQTMGIRINADYCTCFSLS